MPSPGDGGKLSPTRTSSPCSGRRTATRCRMPLICSTTRGVVEQADAIVGALRSGQMPFDGPKPQSQVEKLQQWIDMGMPA
jgi:hypothetical protein